LFIGLYKQQGGKMRDKYIMSRLDKKEFDLINKAADKYGASLSSFLRIGGLTKAREILKNE
jgi:uncharacterized protein (DUF1778 family)